MATINQSIILLNQFLDISGFSKDNQFQKKDFINIGYNAYINGCDKRLIEIKKKQSIKYRGISFSICITGSLFYNTHEPYMISMECSKINKDDHLMIEEYLSRIVK